MSQYTSNMFFCNVCGTIKVNLLWIIGSTHVNSGESASLPQYLGCNTVFDMRLRVTFLHWKTVSLQSNIAHRE
jgi:hypothetical protein